MFRFLVGTAAVVIILSALHIASAIVVPVLVALFIAAVCMPAVVGLEKRNVPRPLALAIVLTGLFVVFAALAAVVGSLMANFTAKIPEYKIKLDDLKARMLEQAAAWDIDVTEATSGGHFDPSSLMDVVPELLEGINSLLSGLFLVVLLVISSSRMLADLRSSSGRTERQRRQRARSGSRRTCGGSMMLKLIAGAIQGACIFVWLLVLGVDYPLLWGLLGGLLNFIPQIGGIVAAAVPGVVSLLEYGMGTALLVGCGIGVVTTAVENFIQPKLFGKGLRLSMATVVLAVVLWGWLLGPIGMFMSVPLTTVLKRVLEEHEDTAWIAALLGDPPAEGERTAARPEEGGP